MATRRRFLHSTLLAGGALALPRRRRRDHAPRMRVVSTWDFGVGANQAAWPVLTRGGNALDAVEAGARWAEGSLCNSTVGRCGYPDRDGVLTLDASIMDGDGRCGAVAALEDIAHPVSVARAVMEKTPHVLLVGEGAQQFAVEQGYEKKTLLTPEAKKAWREWLKTAKYRPQINAERAKPPGNRDNHDTLGILALEPMAASPAPAPPAAWPGSCTAGSATARSSAPGCTSTMPSAPRPPPAWARK